MLDRKMACILASFFNDLGTMGSDHALELGCGNGVVTEELFLKKFGAIDL